MANFIFPKFLELCLTAGLTGKTLKVAAINETGAGTLYTPDTSHQFMSSVPSGAVIARSPALSAATFTAGILQASNLTPAFAALAGTPFEAVILFIDTGNDATSNLIAIFDTATGLPLTPNGNDVNIAWNPSGIIGI